MLAARLADKAIPAIFSYAGRTAMPVAQPLPVRLGGFGGATGLAQVLRSEGISHVVDATHPFAAQISQNAAAACAETGTPMMAFERPAWVAGKGDRWTMVADTEAAVAALPDRPARVFLAIGKQTLAAFAVKPQHHYLLRLVDPPEGTLPLPDAAAIIDRGPFTLAGDLAVLRNHRISHIVAKNSGGAGAEAKLIAARELGLPVILIDRPALPARMTAHDLATVVDWIAHQPARLGV